jgi:hypothetical protein
MIALSCLRLSSSQSFHKLDLEKQLHRHYHDLRIDKIMMEAVLAWIFYCLILLSFFSVDCLRPN